jgi:hypothetical protein
MKLIYLNLFALILSVVALVVSVNVGNNLKDKAPCGDCNMKGCIYEDINSRVKDGSDLEIESAIYEVCRERGIKDSITIDLLKSNYYL